MYTRESSHDIPSGYAGNAFPPMEERPPQEPSPPEEDSVAVGAHPHPPRRGHDAGSWLSRLSLSRIGDINLKSLFSSDLLLIAIALLLVTSKEDDCEDSGDLWILLLLLYFMN